MRREAPPESRRLPGDGWWRAQRGTCRCTRMTPLRRAQARLSARLGGHPPPAIAPRLSAQAPARNATATLPPSQSAGATCSARLTHITARTSCLASAILRIGGPLPSTFFFFLNETAPPESSPLPQPAALPI